MDYGQTYYWNIVSWDNHKASTPGPTWDFTTESAPNNSPYEPYDPDPSNHTTGVDIDYNLGWTGGDPDSGDTVTYDVYFGTTLSPPKIVSNQSETSYDPGTMDYGQTYYWKIVSWDNNGASTSGPIWDFTTESAYDGETGVDIDYNLGWTGGDPDSGDTVTYDVYFGTSSPPPQVVSNQSETIYNPGVLNYGATYYWQIVSWDNHGASTSGPEWNFTVQEEEIPEPPPRTEEIINDVISESILAPVPSDGKYSFSVDTTKFGTEDPLVGTVVIDLLNDAVGYFGSIWLFNSDSITYESPSKDGLSSMVLGSGGIINNDGQSSTVKNAPAIYDNNGVLSLSITQLVKSSSSTQISSSSNCKINGFKMQFYGDNKATWEEYFSDNDNYNFGENNEYGETILEYGSSEVSLRLKHSLIEFSLSSLS